jgi:dTDP-4-amino-4,6-dideoxygalactose transaminase
MLSFINYRMERFDPISFESHMRKYFVAQDQFTRAGILCPGYKSRDRAFWLFPIVTPNKILFVQYLLEAGINAYRGATQLAYVKPHTGYKDAANSKWLMENVVYLPIHWGMTDNEVRETVERVIECFNKLTAYLKSNEIPRPKQAMTVELLDRPRL